MNLHIVHFAKHSPYAPLCAVYVRQVLTNPALTNLTNAVLVYKAPQNCTPEDVLQNCHNVTNCLIRSSAVLLAFYSAVSIRYQELIPGQACKPPNPELPKKSLCDFSLCEQGINAFADIIESFQSRVQPEKLLDINAFDVQRILENEPDFLKVSHCLTSVACLIRSSVGETHGTQGQCVCFSLIDAGSVFLPA